MQLQRHSLAVAGQDREYLLGLPPDLPNAPPLLIAFHGAGSNAEGMRRFTRLDQKAVEAGFVVVFPEGTGRTPAMRSWNSGSPGLFAARQGVDDLAFFRQLVDTLRDRIDSRRVYLTGMSNGGQLCYFLANHAGPLIAGIAPVGCSTLDLEIGCVKPMPILHIHGTSDSFVPYEGGRGTRSAAGSEFVPVQQLIETWAVHNGCSKVPQRNEFTPEVADGTRVSSQVYRDPRGADLTQLLTIHGGGHTWPGIPNDYPFLGPVTANLMANEVIWEFLRRQA